MALTCAAPPQRTGGCAAGSSSGSGGRSAVLCGAGERFEGGVVDVGAVEELRPTPVAHFGGGGDPDEVRLIAFLRHDRGVGVGGDTVHVVEVEPAHIPEGFGAALGGAAGVVVAGVVGLGQFDGFADHRAGDLAEGAFGKIP